MLTREAAHAEGLVGGFSAVYDVLRAMEEAGRVRRGYFVAGLGAAQFALPGADDWLRSFREPSAEGRTLVLSAADPASPFGASVRWPGDDAEPESGHRGASRPKRAAGTRVILHDGKLLAWMGKSERGLLTFLPRDEPERSAERRALARALADLVDEGRSRVVLIATVDGEPTARSPLVDVLKEVGFVATTQGFLKRQAATAAPASRPFGAPGGWGRPWSSQRAAPTPTPGVHEGAPLPDDGDLLDLDDDFDD